MSGFTVQPVTEANWQDLEALFEAKGGPSYCWCMAWRPMPNKAKASHADRKRTLHDSLQAGNPVGLLGYLGGKPVGWCSVAPRESFIRLRDDQTDEPGVWSVTCFYISRRNRGSGISGKLLDAACVYARENGARVIEGYPVDPDSPSYRFMGFCELFRRRGFEEVARAGSRRQVMRLEV